MSIVKPLLMLITLGNVGHPEASFDNVDASELVNMMNSVDFSDPDQAATALQVLLLWCWSDCWSECCCSAGQSAGENILCGDEMEMWFLQVLSLVVGEGEVTTTPFSNIYPTTELPAAGVLWLWLCTG